MKMSETVGPWGWPCIWTICCSWRVAGASSGRPGRHGGGRRPWRVAGTCLVAYALSLIARPGEVAEHDAGQIRGAAQGIPGGAHLSWDEVQQALRSAFFLRRGAGHRQKRRGAAVPGGGGPPHLTNSLRADPSGSTARRGRSGWRWIPRADPGAENSPNDYMSPLHAAEGRHVQRFLARLRGGVEPAGARRPVVQRIPLPSDCCAIRKDRETGRILV